MRVYVDENADFVASRLQSAGHDVLAASLVGRARSDAWHLERAISEQRALVTLDSGYYFLHGLWTALAALGIASRPHYGILTAVQDRQFSDDDWLRALVDHLSEPDDFRGRILTWHPTERAWKEDLRPPWKGII